MALADARHPDAERLAEYADGVLDVEARADIERHLADCAECRAVVMETMAFLENSSATPASAPAPRVIPFRSRRWVTGVVAGLAAAAALVLAVRVVRPEWASGLFGQRSDRPELQELIAAVAKEPTRPVEGRLTGGFKYAPPPSPTRGPGDREVSPDVRIAAAKIEILVGGHHTPANAAVVGVAYLAVGDVNKAIDALEDAVSQQPANASFQSDLSAAYLARASRGSRPDDLPKALASAERAIRSRPDLLEPYFNRLVALQRLHLTQQANAALQDYLSHDHQSPWADEARRLVSVNTPEARRIDAGPSLLNDANSSVLFDLVTDEYLPCWGQRYLAGEVAAADACLAKAAEAARLVALRTGDAMARTIVAAIQPVGVQGSQRGRAAATALRIYGDARRLYKADRASAAAASFERARDSLSHVGNPLSLFAEFHLAIDAYYQGKGAQAAEQLEKLSATAGALKYAYLLGRCLWMQGLVATTLSNYGGALANYRASAEAFRGAHYDVEVANVQTLLATVLDSVGDVNAAWRARAQSLALLESFEDRRRVHTVLANAARAAFDQGLAEASRHFGTAMLANAEAWGQAGAITESHLLLARAAHATDDDLGAEQELSLAQQSLARIPDRRIASRIAAEVFVARADIRVARRSADDIETAQRALAAAKEIGATYLLAKGYLNLGMALVAHRRFEEADQALRLGSARLSDARGTLMSAEARLVFKDSVRALLEERVRLAVDANGDAVGAWMLLEQVRNDEPPSSLESGGLLLRHVQDRMDDNVLILDYGFIGRELWVWAITRGRVDLTRLPASETSLKRLAKRFADLATLRSDDVAFGAVADQLYDALVRPIAASQLRGAIVIVPDGVIGSLPFAALRDSASGRYVVETHTVSYAPSIQSLLRASTGSASSRRPSHDYPALVVSSPDGDGADVVALPAAGGEAARVARQYRHATVLSGADLTKSRVMHELQNASVFHFAGHAFANPDRIEDSYLLLSALDRAPDFLFERDLAALDLSRLQLVVLSACRTAAGPSLHGAGITSIARPFVASGATSVVAALWEVDDEVAEQVLSAFHTRWQESLDAADALRAAQLATIASHRKQRVKLWTWAAFLAIGGSSHIHKRS